MPKKPNVILITVDALRPDHLSFMGYGKKTSPNIDQLAQESTVFTKAFATGPGTPYSFPSILTSTYPLDYQGVRKLESPRMLLSEVFKKEGYVTAAFHSSVYLSDFFGYNRGWDYFEDVHPAPPNLILSPSGKIDFKRKGLVYSFRSFLINSLFLLALNSFPYLFLRFLHINYKVKGFFRKETAGEPVFNQTVKDFITSMKEASASFFLWVHYMDVHAYNSQAKERDCSFPEFLGRTLPILIADYYPSSNFIFKRFSQKNIKSSLELYDKAVGKADRKIGEILDALKQEGLYKDSIVCLASDHGEEFLEHQGADHITDKLYNELLRVSLLIKAPGADPGFLSKNVSLLDLAPTLCSLAKVALAPAFKGKNMFRDDSKLIFHQSGWASEEKIEKWTEIDGLQDCKTACQSDSWKYILSYKNQAEELYDLVRDPEEQVNLAGEKPAALLEMRKAVEEFGKVNPPLSLLAN